MEEESRIESDDVFSVEFLEAWLPETEWYELTHCEEKSSSALKLRTKTDSKVKRDIRVKGCSEYMCLICDEGGYVSMCGDDVQKSIKVWSTSSGGDALQMTPSDHISCPVNDVSLAGVRFFRAPVSWVVEKYPAWVTDREEGYMCRGERLCMNKINGIRDAKRSRVEEKREASQE
jgi:hypothetical protein